MTITFYILLLYLNLTGQRKKFSWKRLETKMNVFFGIYSTLWVLIILLVLFTYFVSTVTFIPLVIILVWLNLELITDHAILIYRQNKIIMQKEFMEVNKESLKQSELLGNLDKKHQK
jgi:hypothetical protein